MNMLTSLFRRLTKNQALFRKPMLEAIEAGDLARIDALITEGADIKAQFTEDIRLGQVLYGASAAGNYAYFALFNGKTEVLAHLKKKGFDFGVHFNDGQTLLTALCVTARHQHIDAKDIQMLIDLGVDPKGTNAKGRNAVHLLTHQDVPFPYEEQEMIVDNSKKIALLLDAGVPIDAQDNDLNTALHLGAKSVTPVEVITMLLERKARSDIPNKDGLYPADLSRANQYQQNAPTELLETRQKEQVAETLAAEAKITAQNAPYMSAATAAALNDAPAVAIKKRTLKV